MLAGDAATQIHDVADDPILERVHPFERARLSQVAEDLRVDVAVACMGQVAHPVACRLPHLGDVAKRFGQPRPGHDDIHRAVIGRDPGRRGERALARVPDRLAFGLAGRQAHLQRIERPDGLLKRTHLARQAFGSPLDVGDQQRARARRQVHVRGTLDGAVEKAVQHFQRGGPQPAADDRRDCLAGLLGRAERRHHSTDRLRPRCQTQSGGRDEGQRAFAAHQHVHEIDLGHVEAGAAPGHRTAVSQHGAQPQDVMRCDAVLAAARPTCVFRQVAADGGRAVAGGIGWVDQAVAARRPVEVRSDDARLDHGLAVGGVQVEDAPHGRERDHQAPVRRHRAAGLPRARAPADDRHALRRGPPHQRSDLLRVRGQRHRVGPAALQPRVAAVGQQGREVSVQVGGADDRPQRRTGRVTERHRPPPPHFCTTRPAVRPGASRAPARRPPAARPEAGSGSPSWW